MTHRFLRRAIGLIVTSKTMREPAESLGSARWASYAELERSGLVDAPKKPRQAGRDSEYGFTLIELLVTVSVVIMVVVFAITSASNAPAVANTAASESSWQSIMERSRSVAANQGALLNVVGGTDVTLYAGWSTGTTPIATWTLPAPVGIEDTTASIGAATFIVYVRRNGTWYATSGAVTSNCADSFSFGHWNGTAVDTTAAVVASCATFAVAPTSEE
jgi:type II secretory pathway pseudopilin PulG